MGLEAQRIKAPLGETAVWDSGGGNKGTLLMIHGLSYPHGVWGPLSKRLLSLGYRVISYDLYGRGLSEYKGSQLRVVDLSNQAIAVLEACAVKGPISAIGLSNSDLIISNLMARFPTLLTKAVMIAPSGNDPRTINSWMRFLCATPMIRGVMGIWLRSQLRRRMAMHERHLPPDAPAAIRDIYTSSSKAMYDNPRFMNAVCAHIAGMPDESNLIADLKRGGHQGNSVSLLHFSDEKDCVEGAMKVFVESWPKSQRFYLPKGGHMALIEFPDMVFETISQILMSPKLPVKVGGCDGT